MHSSTFITLLAVAAAPIILAAPADGDHPYGPLPNSAPYGKPLSSTLPIGLLPTGTPPLLPTGKPTATPPSGVFSKPAPNGTFA